MSGWGAIYNNLVRAMATQSQSLARLQEQIASGARVLRASDDPAGTSRLLGLRSQSARAETYRRNLAEVSRNLQNNYTLLEETSTTLIRVRELVTQASSGTYTSSSRIAMAEEVDSLLERMVAGANSQSLGRYVFGGDKTSVAPYAVVRQDGRIVAVRYQGSQSDSPSPVADGVAYSRLIVGESVFAAYDRQAPVFLGATGAAAGSATSSVRGNVWLRVTHTGTTYEAASQITAADGSQRLDTILGAHTITLTDTGSSQTLRLDDGTETAFTTSDADLVLTNSSGDVVHVDASAWAGATGTFTVQADGALSIDDGATTTPLSAADNIPVTDSLTGTVLYVNGADIVRTGLEPVRVPGTSDLFGMLIAARDALANTRSVPQDQQMALLDESLNSLREVMETVTVCLTSLGGRLQAVDGLRQSLEDRSADAKEQADTIQDVDVVAVTAELARMQTLYEATLSASARLLTLSLLDYL